MKYALALLLAAVGATVRAADPPDVTSLPPALQSAGQRLLSESGEEQAEMAEDLARAHPQEARAFLLQLYESTSALALKQSIVSTLGRRDGSAETKAMLESAARSEQPELADLGRRRLQESSTRSLRHARVAARVAARRATMPVVDRMAAGASRIAVLGDFGTDEGGARDDQERLAKVLQRVHAARPFTLGITVGDNFYPSGLSRATDPRWKRDWEDVYAEMGVEFFASLGNHDHVGDPQGQIGRSTLSPTWEMPGPTYVVRTGAVDLFALDTDAWDDAQLSALKTALAASDAPWKIVYGHHPILSGGDHGDTRELRQQLLPVLKAQGVAAYVAGHDHDMQFLADGQLGLVVSGGGGREPRDVRSLPGRTRFAAAKNGFGVIEASEAELAITLVTVEDLAAADQRTSEFTCRFARTGSGVITMTCPGS